MIDSGRYVIRNALYDDRFAYMSDDREFVGHDTGVVIQVNVLDSDDGLVTLFVSMQNLYIGIDSENGKVVGLEEPQTLQLSSNDGNKFKIHLQGEDNVWFLKDGEDWSTIRVEAASDKDNKYWRFIGVE